MIALDYWYNPKAEEPVEKKRIKHHPGRFIASYTLCQRGGCGDKVRKGNSKVGKVAIGKARYLLNIVFIHLDVRFISFPLYS